jgi:type III pantothenate kinase
LTDPAMQTNLLIDVGNSRAKLALFSGGRLLRHGAVAQNDTAGVRAFSHRYRGPMHRRWFRGTGNRVGHGAWETGPVVTLTGASRSPLLVAYDPPQALGVDRLANAVAAHSLFPRRAVLAIDLGSCITFDLVDAQGDTKVVPFHPVLTCVRAQ